MYYIGAHMSIAKGYERAAKATVEIGGNTLQLFSRNPRGSGVKAFDEKDITGFQEIRRAHRFAPIVAHAPYTLNLAGTGRVYEFACMAVEDDMRRMDQIGIEYFNLHPGSHGGAGADVGIARITRGIAPVLEAEGRVTLLLETMSGKGSEIGATFEELAQIIHGLDDHPRLGVCLDLCHVYAAGYDIVNGLESVLEGFDRIVGMNRLKALHLNDSMHPLGAKKDRHAVIGKGHIGLDATIALMQNKALRTLPFLLETPLEEEGHAEEIRMLRGILE